MEKKDITTQQQKNKILRKTFYCNTCEEFVEEMNFNRYLTHKYVIDHDIEVVLI